MSLLLPLLTSSKNSIRNKLFANNEQGLWLDPSDMNRTKVNWRRNLLNYTEQLDNSYWFRSNTTVSANVATPPGESSAIADKVIATAANGQHTIESAIVMTAGFVYTVTVTAKADGIRYLTINSQGVANQGACFDLQNGTLAIAAGIFVTATNITSLGNGWYTITMTFTNSWGRLSFSLNNSATNAFDSYMGDGVSGILLTKTQVELASSASAYQPITDFATEFKAAFPTHTLYQDSNGVTPCTAAGDPVGLILDQSRGGLGAKTEIALTNGSFDSGLTGWNASNATANTGTSGQVTVTSTSGSAYGFIQGTGANAIVTADTRWYEIVVDCELVSGTGFFGAFTTGGVYSLFTDTGRKTRKMIISGSSLEPRIGVTNVIGTSIIVYDVKLYQIPGNHAYQTTSSARPTLARIPSSGRRNLLTRTEEFDNAAWTKTNSTVTAGVSDPLGGNTAWTLTATAASGLVRQGLNGLSGSLSNSIWIRRRTGTGVVRFYTGAASATQQMQSVITSDWQRLSTATGTATGTGDQFGVICETSGDAVDIWRPQFESGSSATNYQKVTSTHDVTESGFADLWHLSFDGSDDSLVTNAIDFNTWTQDTRRNRLVDTESFGTSSWVKVNTTATENSIAAPNAETTADTFTGSGAGSIARAIYQVVTSMALPVTFSVYAKKGTGNFIQLLTDDAANGFVNFNLDAGTLSATTATGAIENVGNGWYRCSIYITAGAAVTRPYVNLVTAVNATRYEANTLDGTTAYLWGAQLESGTLTAYQRVGSDEMTVIAGVRKLSDAARGMVAELGGGLSTAYFQLNAPTAALGNYGANSSGGTTVFTFATHSAAAPTTDVVAAAIKISSDSTVLRTNGVQRSVDSTDQGAGNYSNNIIYIGRRGGSSLPFNGHLYQLIVRGRTTSNSKLLEAERFVGRKTGVSF